MKVGAAARAHGVHFFQYFTQTGTSKTSKTKMASIFTSPSCLATHTLKLAKEVGRRFSQVFPVVSEAGENKDTVKKLEQSLGPQSGLDSIGPDQT